MIFILSLNKIDLVGEKIPINDLLDVAQLRSSHEKVPTYDEIVKAMKDNVKHSKRGGRKTRKKRRKAK